MTLALLYKLLAIVGVVALGWVVGKLRWLGDEQADPARVLSNAAFFIFAPALLFRTTARIDLGTLPWAMLAAFFVPVVGLMLVVYGWQRWRRPHSGLPAAGPAVRAITATFGNSVQIGIPLAAALFGEAGLGLHLTVVSLHALVLLAVLTTLVEMDLARESHGHDLRAMLKATVRNTVVHPVVLPVLAGLAWNATGWPLAAPLDEVLQVLGSAVVAGLAWNAGGLPIPGVLDEVLLVLGSAVVPLCLTLIGMSLAYLGLPRPLTGALGLCLLKLWVMPALVLLVAHGGFGLSGLPLGVVVILAGLPAGSNALMFAQRYRAQEAETTAAVVLSTLAVVVNVPIWMAVLSLLAD